MKMTIAEALNKQKNLKRQVGRLEKEYLSAVRNKIETESIAKELKTRRAELSILTKSINSANKKTTVKICKTLFSITELLKFKLLIENNCYEDVYKIINESNKVTTIDIAKTIKEGIT